MSLLLKDYLTKVFQLKENLLGDTTEQFLMESLIKKIHGVVKGELFIEMVVSMLENGIVMKKLDKEQWFLVMVQNLQVIGMTIALQME